MVYGETGRYPHFMSTYVKCVKFSLCILKMSPHRLPYKAYRMLLYLHMRTGCCCIDTCVQDAAVSTHAYKMLLYRHMRTRYCCIDTCVQDAAVSTHAYKMLLYLHERNRRTWASSVCYVLYRYGFDEVWENQGVGDEIIFWENLKTDY